MARLSAACTSAVTTLTGLLGAESESVRLGAARSILDMATRWREQDELARRLDNIESWIEVLDANRPPQELAELVVGEIRDLQYTRRSGDR